MAGPKAKSAPAQARNLLGTIKRLFAWAVEEGTYDLHASPEYRAHLVSVLARRAVAKATARGEEDVPGAVAGM